MTIGLSVLFVNYNSWRECATAVASLLAHPHDGRLEVIVVDNASTIDAPEARQHLEETLAAAGGRLIRNGRNEGYAGGMNRALRHATGDYVLVCNPDLVFVEHCVPLLLRYARDHRDVGAVMPEGYWDEGFECRLPVDHLPTLSDLAATTLASLSPRLARRYARKRTEAMLRIWSSAEHVDLEMLSGCCFLMPRTVIERVGLFDPSFPLYFEDTDLARRLRYEGLRIVQVQGARIVHLYNRSAGTVLPEALEKYRASRRLYFGKWYGPAGALFADTCRWILDTRWGRRRSRLAPRPFVHEVRFENGVPVIDLPRSSRRFAVEHSLDPHFFLAGAAFGSGDRWSPGPALLANYPTSIYLRVVDLEREQPEELGVYHYRRPDCTSRPH